MDVAWVFLLVSMGATWVEGQEGELPLGVVSSSHPDSALGYFEYAFEADWNTWADIHPDAAGYLWVIDQDANTVVTSDNATFTTARQVTYVAPGSGIWQLHLAARDIEGEVIPQSQIRFTFTVASVHIASETHPDNEGAWPGNDFTARVRAVAGGTLSDAQWELAIANAPWIAREDHATVVFDNRIWVLGGWTGSRRNDVWYSEDGMDWTQVTANADWSPRYRHQALVFDNKMWILGGEDGAMRNDVWYSEDGVEWTQAATDAGWSPRQNHSVVVFENKMWVIGGWDGARRNDVWYSEDGVSWTWATWNAGWTGRNVHTSVVFNDKMWLLGGHDGADRNDVWFSEDGTTWIEATANAAWAGRYGHASVVYDGNIWVLGGFNRRNGALYSSDGVSWTNATGNVAWSGRQRHGAVVFNHHLWILGGFDGNRRNDVWRMEMPAVASASVSDYYYVLDTEPDTVPDPATASWSAGGVLDLSFSVLDDGYYWLHVVGQDALGNLSLPVRYGFRIGDPRIPPVSETHPDPEHWYFSDTFTVDWSDWSAQYPGIEGYLYVIDRNWSTEVDIFNGIHTFEAALSRHEMPPGTWYFHIAAVDIDGNVVPGARIRFKFQIAEMHLNSETHPDSAAAHFSKDFSARVRAVDGSRVDAVQTTSSAAWTGRHHHGTVVFDNKLWVLGGNDGSLRNDVWHTVDGNQWTRATANAGWSPRDNFGVAVYDRKIWVIGGWDGARRNDVWYSEDGISWMQASWTNDWSPRNGHQVAVFQNKLWVFGGWDGDNRLNDVWHSQDGATWTRATAAAEWSPRDSHAVVVFQDKLWVLGGDEGDRLNDVWFSEDGIEWHRAVIEAEWAPRGYHAAVVYNNLLWVLGGLDGSSNYHDVWFSRNGSDWTRAEVGNIWVARYAHTSAVYKDRIWVLGGFGLTWNDRRRDVWSMAYAPPSPGLRDSVRAYHYLLDSLPDTLPEPGTAYWFEGNPVDIEYTGLAPGAYWLHVRGEDTAPMLTDRVLRHGVKVAAPAPRVQSQTHSDPTRAYYGNRDVQLQWDSGGVPDVVAYYYTLDHQPDTTPTADDNITANTEISYLNLAPGLYWFHIRSLDQHGFLSPVAHYRIGIASAARAPVVSSPTHPNPYLDYDARNVQLTWMDPDGTSVSYYWVFDQHPDTTPTMASENTTALSRTFFNQEEGIYYFHVRGVDAYGNLSQVGRMRVNVISGSPGPPSLCEALDNCGLVWTTGGTGSWIGQTEVSSDGLHAAQSATFTGDRQNSWVETVVYGPGILSFQWSISTRDGVGEGQLHFRINGQEQSRITGTRGWQSRNYYIKSGTHVLRWNAYCHWISRYTTSWLDNIEWIPDGWYDGFHPADVNTDWQLGMNEVTAYGAAWKTAAHWRLGPTVIPMGYVTRAGYLWKVGEAYQYDGTYPTACWVSLSKGAGQDLTGTQNHKATRTMKDGEILLSVRPEPGALVYAVKEQLPEGIAPADVSDGGHWDATGAALRWGPFFDDTPRVLRYTPDSAVAPGMLMGWASFDGVDIVIQEKDGDDEMNLEGESFVEGENADEGETPTEGEDPDRGEGPSEGETPAEGEDPDEGEGPSEGETPAEGEDPIEGEVLDGDEGSPFDCLGGCRGVKKFRNHLGDWTLVGLSLISLLALANVRRK